ncbi:MAG: aromatic ring-hydroxylating dioxygenase subunit alpha [Actinobacteria bacterium]|nr:aromatic ring-hydroxylating dioxygenase subunit alpha [Actinomycetota bacterium]
MLTVEQNEELTQVGPGTPMGELLRRYWYPIAFEQDFDTVPAKSVRLLSEDWTLYKTPSGKYGIIAEKCAHRSASLTYGVVHEDGIRCGYHGWKYDFDGQCVEQPAESDNQNFRDRVKMKSGKAQTMGGMVWVYVGPDPAPELPRFDVFVKDGIRDVGFTTIPCNWLQIMENSVDPHHVEWLHGYYFNFLGETNGFEAPKAFQKKHIKTGFDEMEWGILKRRVLEGHSEANDDWAIGHPLVFPFYMRVGGAYIDQMQIRVPIDDTHTWKLFYSTHNPGEELTINERPVVYEYLWKDEEGRFITDYIEGQDVMAWVSQGAITDRTQEHLGRSDAGVALLRKMFKENMRKVADGEDPIGTIREKHDIINLPCEKDKFGAERTFAKAWITGGSMRYSPQADELIALHVAYWESVAKAEAGA